MENLNLQSKKERYFVFMDIDGTLWDYEYGEYYQGPFVYENPYPRLKSSSISAVNILLKSLEEKYDTMLVITSRKRENMPECIEYLKQYGLSYDKPILCTPFVYYANKSRGEKIIDFMSDRNIKPERLRKKSLVNKVLNVFISKGSKNYVVLEDDYPLVKKSIPKRRLILANHNNRSLTIKQVKDYLKINNIQVKEDSSPEMQ